jgi:Domain of unknown function (DUF4260)
MADIAGTKPTGAVTGGLRILLRLEGLTLLAVMTLLYAVWGVSWWIYVVLFLAPDLSFAGYLAGPRVGALVYNAAHISAASDGVRRRTRSGLTAGPPLVLFATNAVAGEINNNRGKRCEQGWVQP